MDGSPCKRSIRSKPVKQPKLVLSAVASGGQHWGGVNLLVKRAQDDKLLSAGAHYVYVEMSSD